MPITGKRLGPVFPYYGAKWRSAREYPTPRFRQVIEPFAGGGGYSLHALAHGAIDTALLIDRSPHVVAAWHALLRHTTAELMDLPGDVSHVETLPEWAQALVGFWLNPASAVPKRTRSSRCNPDAAHYFAGSVWSPKTRDRIARERDMIAHAVRCGLGEWRDVFGRISHAHRRYTVFVDPPYSTKAGSYYPGAPWDASEYAALAGACIEAGRLGHHVLVCGQVAETWAPFVPLHRYHGSTRDTLEGLWEITPGGV